MSKFTIKAEAKSKDGQDIEGADFEDMLHACMDAVKEVIRDYGYWCKNLDFKK